MVWPTNATLYHWVEAELVDIISFFSIASSFEGAFMNVGLSFDWLVSHVDSYKRMCNFFDGLLISFY